MKNLIVCISVLLSIYGLCAIKIGAQPSDENRLAEAQMPLNKQFDNASKVLESATDQEALTQALSDIVNLSQTPESRARAMEYIDEMIRKSSNSDDTIHQAQLAKARLLGRDGKKQEAAAIFKRAIAEKWNANVYREYYASLWENGDYVESAIDEYERQTGITLSQEDRDFYNCHNDFLETFSRLYAKEVYDPSFKAMETAYPLFKESEHRPQAREIGKTLCLAVDGDYETSLTLLDEIEEECIETLTSDSNCYDETKHIPLYRTAILLFQGTDFQSARDAFTVFIERNQQKPGYILERTIKIIHAICYSPEYMKRIPELTEYFINTPFYVENLKADNFNESDVASLLNNHRRGLWEQGRKKDAYNVTVEIVSKYYPQTQSGTDAMLGLALYEVWLNDNEDESERLLRDIIENARYAKIIPHAKAYLAGSAYSRGDYKTAFVLVEDVLKVIPENPTGEYIRLKDISLQLKNKVLIMMNVQ